MKTYLLIGNYGVGNVGDEALRDYFEITFPGVNWKVLSACPSKEHDLPRLPFGLRSLWTPWWKTLSALWNCDGVVFGSGTLFTDTESVWACFLWWWHGFWARVFRKNIFLAAQGIGPFQTKVGEWCARWIVARASYISVRDKESYKRIENWDMSTKIIQTYDPVFLLFKSQQIDVRSENVFIVIPRKNSNEMFMNTAVKLSSGKQWEACRILSLEPNNPNEQSFCQKLSKKMGATIVEVGDWKQLLQEVAKCSEVLSQRFHGSIAAKVLGKELISVPLAKGDKLDALGSSVELSDIVLSIESATVSLRQKLASN